VSGGSVIGAYFHAHQGDLPSFEAKIRDVLAQGLVKPMRRKFFGACWASRLSPRSCIPRNNRDHAARPAFRPFGFDRHPGEFSPDEVEWVTIGDD
jgi:hypothetical protein